MWQSSCQGRLTLTWSFVGFRFGFVGFSFGGGGGGGGGGSRPAQLREEEPHLLRRKVAYHSGLQCDAGSGTYIVLVSFKPEQGQLVFASLQGNWACLHMLWKSLSCTGPVLYRACPVQSLSCTEPVLYRACPVERCCLLFSFVFLLLPHLCFFCDPSFLFVFSFFVFRFVFRFPFLFLLFTCLLPKKWKLK